MTPTHIHTTSPVKARIANLRQLVCLLALCACALLVFASSAQAEGFSVSPLEFDFDQKAGTGDDKTITVLNTNNSKMGFTIATEDISGNKDDPNANPVLLGATVASPISGAGWLNPSTNSFTLDSGEAKKLTVRVTVPEGAQGGHYAAVTVSAAPQIISASLTAQSRVAVLFMMNAGNVPPPELVIEDVVTTTAGQTIIDYRNEGRKAATPDATITYVDPITGEVVATRKAKDCGTALPGGVARCVIGKPNGDLGLVANGSVMIDNDGIKTKAKLPTEWSGSWSSMLLPLAGLFMLIFYFARIRRRVDEDEEDDGVLPAL